MTALQANAKRQRRGARPSRYAADSEDLERRRPQGGDAKHAAQSRVLCAHCNAPTSQRCWDASGMVGVESSVVQACPSGKLAALCLPAPKCDQDRQWHSTNPNSIHPSGNPVTSCVVAWTPASTKTMCWYWTWTCPVSTNTFKLLGFDWFRYLNLG